MSESVIIPKVGDVIEVAGVGPCEVDIVDVFETGAVATVHPTTGDTDRFFWVTFPNNI